MMKKIEQLEQIIKNLCERLGGAILVNANKDGSCSVVCEKQSPYSFLVRFDGKENTDVLFDNLLPKLKDLGYSIDLETLQGLSPCFPKILLKIDVANKKVFRPLIVSVGHFHHLRDEASIWVKDVIDNFDEIVIKKNKELVDSLDLYHKNKKQSEEA